MGVIFRLRIPKLMEINCPSCNEAILIADEDMYSPSLECPFCQQSIKLESETSSTHHPPSPQKNEPPPPVSDEAKRLLISKLLIQCPACGKAVSKQADICLSCGHPIYSGVLGKAGASRIINITVLVLLVICVFFCLITNPFRL